LTNKIHIQKTSLTNKISFMISIIQFKKLLQKYYVLFFIKTINVKKAKVRVSMWSMIIIFLVSSETLSLPKQVVTLEKCTLCIHSSSFINSLCLLLLYSSSPNLLYFLKGFLCSFINIYILDRFFYCYFGFEFLYDYYVSAYMHSCLFWLM
jgi:hypothetical protein